MASTNVPALEPLFPAANEGSTEHAIDERFEVLNQKIGAGPGVPARAAEDPEEFKTRVHEAVDEYLNGEGSPLTALVSAQLKNLSGSDLDALKKALGIDK